MAKKTKKSKTKARAPKARPKRFVLLQLRAEHFDQLAAAAKDAGLPPTTFVRRAVKSAIGRVGYVTKSWDYAERVA